MDFEISLAEASDVEELLQLFFVAYGKDYPVIWGTDRHAMLEMITHPQLARWYVARLKGQRTVVASTVFELDYQLKIAKLSGVVVQPQHRKLNLAFELISRGAKILLEKEGFNSIYTTTRTVSVGPQLMCLKDGFLPLGIFPNAHKLAHFETLTFLGKYRDGILQQRRPLTQLPEKLLPIFQEAKKILQLPDNPQPIAAVTLAVDLPHINERFEVIFAPQFVYRRFLDRFQHPYERVYPFHKPNILLVSENGQMEVYAYLSKKDRYCTIVSINAPIATVRPRIAMILEQLTDLGASYVELLLPIEQTAAIETILEHQFLPTAFYPAMIAKDGVFMDFVVLSRAREPLNFKGMAIAQAFKPYIDQYVALWKQTHLDVLQVLQPVTSHKKP